MARAIFILVLFAISCENVHSQRLSQGASDWYMRFHDYGKVRRNVDRPVVMAYHVQADIKHGYAVTTVTSTVHNPSKSKDQTYEFKLTMPKDAFVSNVTLARVGDDGESRDPVRCDIGISEWVETALIRNREHRRKHRNAVGHKHHANGTGHHHHKDANGDDHHHSHEDLHKNVLPEEKFRQVYAVKGNSKFQQFVLPIHLQPGDDVRIELVYEHFVKPLYFGYDYAVSLNPGQIVKDFSVDINISKEEREIWAAKAWSESEIVNEAIDKHGVINVFTWGINFSLPLTAMEQQSLFGSHGMDCELKLFVDLEEKGSGLVVEGDIFLHKFEVYDTWLRRIPRHVVILLDASMSSQKLTSAKEAANFIEKQGFSDPVSDKISVVAFKEFPTAVRTILPNKMEEEDFDAEQIEHLEGPLSDGISGNVSRAVEKGLNLLMSQEGESENTQKMIFLLTDGHSYTDDEEAAKNCLSYVKDLSEMSGVPIHTLGIGFDADMGFLRSLAESSGGNSYNVIEDLEVVPQLEEDLTANRIYGVFKEFTLKDLELKYLSEEIDRKSLTRHHFDYFHHYSYVLVAGKWKELRKPNKNYPYYPEFEVEVIAQPFEDPTYTESIVIPFAPEQERCAGEIALCDAMKFEGSCITLNSSQSDLQLLEFDDTTASLNITGDCAWVAFTESRYEGRNEILFPGTFEVLPDMYKTISSLKKIPVRMFDNFTAKPMKDQAEETEEDVSEYPDESFNEIDVDQDPLKKRLAKAINKLRESKNAPSKKENYLERVWAYMTIRDVLNDLDKRPETVSRRSIVRAIDLAKRFDFLTPLTDLFLIEDSSSIFDEDPASQLLQPPPKMLVENNLITYSDLQPTQPASSILGGFETLETCSPPVECVGKFAIEKEEVRGMSVVGEPTVEEEKTRAKDCSSTLEIFTEEAFTGDSLIVEESLNQIYHMERGPILSSIKGLGDCCWLLFDWRFYRGKVEKVCGNFETSRQRNRTLGSVKNVGPMEKAGPMI